MRQSKVFRTLAVIDFEEERKDTMKTKHTQKTEVAVAPRGKSRTALLKTIDKELRYRIDVLLSGRSEATIADRMFLIQVLMQLESFSYGEELGIASAFETCIRNQGHVVLEASEYEGMRANARKVLEMPVATISVQ